VRKACGLGEVVCVDEDDAKPLAHGQLDDGKHRRAPPRSSVRRVVEVLVLAQTKDVADHEHGRSADLDVAHQAKGDALVLATSKHGLVHGAPDPQGEAELEPTHPG
jgi:hypothetical protein